MTHRVGFNVFDGVTMLDVTGPAEVLQQVDRRAHPYDLTLHPPQGPGPDLHRNTAERYRGGSRNRPLRHRARRRRRPPDRTPPDTELPEATRTVATRVASGVHRCLRPGRTRPAGRAPRDHPPAARRPPRVRVQPDAIHVQDGRFVTSAGITVGIDLALASVENDHGADTARHIARELVVFLQRPGGQSQFTTATTPPARNDLLRTLINSVLNDPAGEHDLPSMARTAAVSPRHLTRLFRSELGTTPARWVERIRLDRAQQLLLDGHSVTSAAQHSGFGSDETLRRAFLRHLGITPTVHRQRFATTGTTSAGKEGAPHT